MVRARQPLREPDLLLALRREVARHLTHKSAAEHLGISAQYLTDVLARACVGCGGNARR